MLKIPIRSIECSSLARRNEIGDEEVFPYFALGCAAEYRRFQRPLFPLGRRYSIGTPYSGLEVQASPKRGAFSRLQDKKG